MSDDLVLAAVERAERHRERQGEGVMMSDIAEHLGFVHGSWTTRRLRPQIEVFIAAGLLVRSRRHGVVVWALTSSGRRRIEQAGGAVGLPESPQHREWRHARALAAERIDGVCERASGVLEEAMDALDSEGVRSDAWFALAERLQSACWQFGSVTYCLSEWPEPTTPVRTLTIARSRATRRSTRRSWAGCSIGAGGVATCGSGPTPDPALP